MIKRDILNKLKVNLNEIINLMPTETECKAVANVPLTFKVPETIDYDVPYLKN